MTKTQKTFISLVLLGVAGYGIYTYKDALTSAIMKPDIKDSSYESNFNSTGTSENKPNETTPTSTDNTGSESATSQESTALEAKLDEYLNDCENECRSHTGDDHQYCLQICGLSTPVANDKKTCAEREGRDRDMCFKEQAIKEKSDQLCDSVSDKLLRESCINAVAEDILD